VLVPVRAEANVQLTLMRFIVVVLILADETLGPACVEMITSRLVVLK
jgi:hypothetical protein